MHASSCGVLLLNTHSPLKLLEVSILGACTPLFLSLMDAKTGML